MTSISDDEQGCQLYICSSIVVGCKATCTCCLTGCDELQLHGYTPCDGDRPAALMLLLHILISRCDVSFRSSNHRILTVKPAETSIYHNRDPATPEGTDDTCKLRLVYVYIDTIILPPPVHVYNIIFAVAHSLP